MKLDDLEALLAAATRVPWCVSRNGYGIAAAASNGEPDCIGVRVGLYPHIANASREDDSHAIVALMNAAPALLRVAKAARAFIEETEEGGETYAELLNALDEVDDG